MIRPLSFALLVLLAGCLDAQEGGSVPGAKACGLLGSPHDVARNAPNTAGPGPRTIRIASVPSGDAIAVWWQDGDHLAVLHLRSEESSSGFESPQVSSKVSINPSVAKVPTGVTVRIVAGQDEWTQDGLVTPGTDEALIDLAAPIVRGSIQDTWSEPVSFGPASATWQPVTMDWADDKSMARLESLHLELLWDNGAAGGADFGVAVGPNTGGGFHYVNGQYQASPGAQRESRDLGAADFAQLGWTNATRPQVGPSVSTGAFATTGIGYELSWEATFGPDPDLADVCQTLGDVEAVLVASDQP